MLKSKWIRAVGIILLCIVILGITKNTWLRGIGLYLVATDEPIKGDYACVLSGGAYDRGLYAAQLYNKGLIKHIICTGGNPDFDLKAYGLDLLESDVTRHRLILQGVDSADIILIPQGTSTQEESDLLLPWCAQHKIKNLAVISSRFHGRRVRNVFKSKIKKSGIGVQILGAPSTVFKEETWWKNEYGLLAVNNEYVKLLYYMLK